jgi:hypothetical protein
VFSITPDLATIHYAAEIVGWSGKRQLGASRRAVLNRVIGALQPGERELYDASRAEDGSSVNLLYVRRMHQLKKPFSVTQLIKCDDGARVSDRRTTAGGWTYVRAENLKALLQ